MPARKFSNNVLWCLLQSAIDDIISFVNLNIRSTFFTGTHMKLHRRTFLDHLALVKKCL